MNRIALLAFSAALAGCAAMPATTRSAPSTAEPPSAAADAPGAPVTPAAPAGAELAAAAKVADGALRRQLTDRGLARRDGWVYGSDAAALLLYAAQRGDAQLYDVVLAAAQPLIRQNPDDPYTAGFVLARTRDGAKPATSSSADAIVMARALWTGAAAFDRAADRELALAILDGYAKHAYVLQNVWLVRESFDFKARSFANLSGLAGYHPDFLAEAERRAGRAGWRGFAERSYALLDRAATPSQLLLPVIQPEVGATYPGAGLELYAPNGVTSLEDACLAAEGSVRGRSATARGLLEFTRAAAAKGRLRALYSVEDRSAASEAPLSAAGTGCLARLAAALGDDASLKVLDPRLAAELQSYGGKGRDPVTAGPVLLAAHARGAF